MQAARTAAPRVWTGLVLNGDYTIGSLIEQCSTFEIYEGTEITTGDRVSLKILLPELATDPKTVALFLDEMHIMERVSHPGLFLRGFIC
jgi:serine/threonine-protein kinase